MDAGLLRVQSRMDKENVAEMKAMLSFYAPSLHPHHALLTETKQHLAAALDRAEGYWWGRPQLEDCHQRGAVEVVLHPGTWSVEM